jgi:hypothetical protein
VLVFAWVLLLLVPVSLPTGWQRIALLAGVVLAITVHVSSTHAQYRRFNHHEMRGFSDLIHQIPRGQALAVHYQRSDSPYANYQALWHWPKLYTLSGAPGGRTNDTFAWRSTSYVTLTERGLAAGTYQGRPGLNTGALAAWDYLLAQGESSRSLSSTLGGGAELVASRGQWHLFRIDKER